MANGEQKYLSPEETAMFCEQVALILKSGILLFDGIGVLCESYADGKYADQFKKLGAVVKETGSLYEAVKAVGIFPPYMVNSIRISERAGTSDQVVASLAAYYSREGQTRRAVKNAIAYPLVLLAMMALVIVVLVVRVMPIFSEVFANLGSGMSDTSIRIMNFGIAAGQVVLGLVALVLVIAAVLYLMYRLGRRRQVMALISKVIPAVGGIREKTTAVRFASVMSMMMSSGFPLEEAIGMIPDVLSDEDAKQKVRACLDRMEKGESFPQAVEATRIFDGIYNKMVRMGYMVGQTDSVMNKLAVIYEDEIDDSIRKLVSLIEPSMVAVLSVVIGAVLLAVMLPLASILSSL